MVRIFSNVVAFYLKNHEFPPEYFTLGNQIVTATMEVSLLKTNSDTFELIFKNIVWFSIIFIFWFLISHLI